MKPVLLMILDGWGSAPSAPDNAIFIGNTPNWDELMANHSHTLIKTSGQSVGLPEGQMGNSEVGHMNIGLGRVVYQSLTKIQQAVNQHGFAENKVLTSACDVAENKAIHIVGLVSPGGVHSHEDHIVAMIELAKKCSNQPIYLHAFLDGRDVPPRSAKVSLQRFEAMQDEQFRIASITGRYYAMDRDNNWDRVEKACHVIVDNKAEFTVKTAVEGLELAYSRDENDEFIKATVIEGASPLSDGDSVILMNFRADRARQLTRVFYENSFNEFVHRRVELSHLVTLTQYQSELQTEIAFPPEILTNSLGEVVSVHGLKQLRIAETEKYAHVTYFLNGGEEEVFDGEDRILVKSPTVATYDLQPEMSAPEVTEKLVEAIKSEKYALICVNYANGDMVGHSGIMSAAVAAVEALDKCIGKVIEATNAIGMVTLITADHGNVEQMTNHITGEPLTSHTSLPVPLVMVGDEHKLIDKGALCDLAPTVLALLGLSQPDEMTGKSLLR
ncbi:MAG: 2,3-bisphosphoglycerate-independent phosphoglycerate mutase [Ostreibacterium sp.]